MKGVSTLRLTVFFPGYEMIMKSHHFRHVRFSVLLSRWDGWWVSSLQARANSQILFGDADCHFGN